MSRAHVVKHVRDSCCGTWSGPMAWDVMRSYMVGRVQGPCWGTSSGPMLGRPFKTHEVGRVRNLCCGTYSRPISQSVCYLARPVKIYCMEEDASRCVKSVHKYRECRGRSKLRTWFFQSVQGRKQMPVSSLLVQKVCTRCQQLIAQVYLWA